MSRIYEIFGTNAHAMTRALMESAGAACKIPSGASVALKPNLVVAASPETGATTHAGVLSGAIEYLRDHGFRDISIIEGSWVGDDTGDADKVHYHLFIPADAEQSAAEQIAGWTNGKAALDWGEVCYKGRK